MIEYALKRVVFGTNNQFVRGYQENVTYRSDKTCNFPSRVSPLYFSDAVPYDYVYLLFRSHMKVKNNCKEIMLKIEFHVSEMHVPGFNKLCLV